jgi:4-hydroxy-tetrahydrodipicolinate synthase
MWVTQGVTATVGFGAGVGAFKTALWQMGIFNTNQMREPVQALTGRDVEGIAEVLRANGMVSADFTVREDWA